MLKVVSSSSQSEKSISRSVKTVESDKTMDQVVDKFEEMEREGKARVVRQCSYEELKRLPADQLRPSERALIMFRENKGI